MIIILINIQREVLRAEGAGVCWVGEAEPQRLFHPPVFTRTIEKIGSFLARAKASKKISPLFFLVAGDAILT